MKCLVCGASAIDGAENCYRCGSGLAVQDAFSVAREHPPSAPPSRPRSPSRSPSARPPASGLRPAAPPRPKTVALTATVCFALAGVFVLDAVALGDPPAVLLLSGLFALLGVGLLKGWRQARGGAIVACGVAALLGLASLWGGALAGWLILVASAVALVALHLPSARGHFKQAAA